MRRLPHPCLALPALLATACLEIGETVEVRQDGSVAVEVSASGDLVDLVDGHPVPLGGPWSPADARTVEWLALVGPEGGGPAVREQLGELGLFGTPHGEPEKGQIRVVGDFASAGELPRFFAPAGHPYRDAHLERDTSVEIRRVDGHRVYFFERTFRARTWASWSILERVGAKMPEDLEKRLESPERRGLPAPEDLELIWQLGTEAIRETTLSFARHALSGIYTLGDASLSTEAFERVLADLRATAGSSLTRERLAAALGEEPGSEDLLPLIEAEERQALRVQLGVGLAREGLAERSRNAVLERLEWSFTALDQTGDLDDETFEFRLRLPGHVVDGNHQETRDGALYWKFVGGDLHDRDLVLRAVSVLD